MEPASRNFRGDIAFAERQKLNHVTRTVRTLSPKREDIGNRRTRQAIDPRWDPYSGEITSSDKGKPQSVKPKTFGISLRQANGQRGRTSDLRTPTPVVERIRKLNNDTNVDISEARDSTYLTSSASNSVSNLEILSQEPSNQEEDRSQPQSPSEVTIDLPRTPKGVTQFQNSELDKKVLSEEKRISNVFPRTVNEIPDNNDDHGNKHDNIAASFVEEKVLALPNQQPSSGSANSNKELWNIEQHPSNGSDNTTQLLISEKKFQTKKVQAHGPNNLSIITSVDVQKSSRSSDHIIDQTLIKSRALAQQESIVINRVRSNENIPKHHQITRKAIPLGSPIFISMSIPPNIDIKDRHLLNKSLPQTPAENSSNDLVTALQVHLDNLAHRRRNITRSIRQMTELMPRDNLLITDEVRLKREHEKKKVAMLREEEAEIRREEHEVGLRLHRAWKRTESGAVYEPTSLWVRRVTGVGKNWCWPHQDLPVC